MANTLFRALTMVAGVVWLLSATAKMILASADFWGSTWLSLTFNGCAGIALAWAWVDHVRKGALD